MADQDVRVAITATSAELEAAFTRALQSVNNFKQQSEEAGRAMGGSFREANAAVRLLNEELGTGLSRHLTSILSQSALLGPAFEAALPVAAAVGFAAAAYKIYENISGVKDEVDKISQNEKLAESFTEVAKQVAKIQSHMQDIGQTSQQIALHAAQSAQFELISLQARVSVQREMAAALEKSDQKNSGFAFDVPGATGPRQRALHTADSGMADALRTLADKQAVPLAVLQTKLDEAIANMGQSFIELADKSSAEAQRAREAWITALDSAEKSSKGIIDKDNPAQKQIDAIDEQIAKWREVAAERTGINAIANQYTAQLQQQKALIEAQVAADKANPLRNLAPAKMPDLGAPGMPLYSGTNAAMNLYNIQKNQADAIKEAQRIYDDTATAAQKYSDTIAVLTQLLNDTRISQDQFTAAAIKAGVELDKNPVAKYYHQLGQEIGRTIGQALTFEQSWSKTFKNIMADIIKLIIQMEVFDQLAKSFGFVAGQSGSGGFWGQLFAGMGGMKADGGPVSQGMSYLVGERGPEIFTPGASGAITPNGALGSHSTIYQIDARGADAGVEMRIRRAIAESENRAVHRAVAAAADQRARH